MTVARHGTTPFRRPGIGAMGLRAAPGREDRCATARRHWRPHGPEGYAVTVPYPLTP